MRKIIFLTLIIFAIGTNAAEMQKYIRNSGGNYLGSNKTMRAVLKSANSSAPIMTFSPQADGSYSISFDNGGTRVYLAAGANADSPLTFQSEYNASICNFNLEKVDNTFYRIKSKATNKYVGVENVISGTIVYAKHDGSSSLCMWMLNDTEIHDEVAEERDYYLFPAQKLQRNEGAGVSLCFWANMCGKELWNDYYLDRLIDWLVDPEGLNINLFRYNIGGGDDPEWKNCDEHHFVTTGKGARAEFESFKDGPDKPYDWTRDAAQRRVMLKIKEKRPDAVFEAFSNSAPWWMTVSGCCAGGPTTKDDNLKPEYYEAFAHYLVDVCKHYKDVYGIEFKTLEPFNEPQAEYWAVGLSQEGCHFSTASQAEFLKVLAPILAESGLSTKISTSDETNILHALSDIKYFKKAGVDDLVGQWNTHSYIATDRSRSQYGNLVRATGRPLWMSEYGPMQIGSGITGNLATMQQKFNDLHYLMPNAWFDWMYMDYSDQWSTVSCAYENPENAVRLKNYYVHAQVSRFIKAGYYFVPSLSSKTIAAISPDGSELVIVALNDLAYQSKHTITLPYSTINGNIVSYVTDTEKNMASGNECEVLSGNKIRFSVAPLSIATFIVPITSAAVNAIPSYGDKFVIVPQSAHEMAVTADIQSLVLSDIISGEESQIWTVTEGDNGLILTNGNGKTISYSAPDSKLSLTNTGGTPFTFTTVADYFHAIQNSGKGLALTGNALTTGTQITMGYDATDPEQDTRHWLLLKVEGNQSSGINDINESLETETCGQTEYYDILGRKLNGLQPGLNIVKKGKKVTKIMN